MKNAISAEFLKLRRSRALLLAAIASVLPPAVKCLRAVSAGGTDWQAFLSTGQELMAFGMLITVMLLSAWVFTMEYRHGTAAAIFTTGTNRAAVFGAKLIVLAAVIVALNILSAASQLLFGWLAVGRAPTAETAWRFACVMEWYAVSYFLLTAVVALPAVLTKRFMLTAVITMGYYILIFPFHTKNPYVCPFLTPAIVAAKLYGATGYIFAFSYDNLSTGVLPAGIVLACLAVAAVVIGVTVYRKSDAVR
jgi:hypothetical protein